MWGVWKAERGGSLYLRAQRWPGSPWKESTIDSHPEMLDLSNETQTYLFMNVGLLYLVKVI